MDMGGAMVEPLSSQDAGGLFPRLQERFGLREDPLAMESPFYPDAQRQHALETLRHLCGFGDMALLLTAPAGFGKTRILGELVRSEGARLEFVWLPAAELTSAEALAGLLFQSLGRSVPEHMGASDAVFGFMAASSDQTLKGRRQVVLVDDAEQATGPVLKLLLRAFLAADTATAAVPVIAGQNELADTLGAATDSRIHHVQLPPLTEVDIRGYLQPRIHRAGGSEAELLSPANMRQMMSLSQGSFGRLRRTAPAVWLGMTSPAGAGGATRLAATPWRALRWAALALVLLAGSWWLVSAQYDRTTERAQRQVIPIEPPVRAVVTVGPDSPAEESLPEPAVEPIPLMPEPVVADQGTSGLEAAGEQPVEGIGQAVENGKVVDTAVASGAGSAPADEVSGRTDDTPPPPESVPRTTPEPAGQAGSEPPVPVAPAFAAERPDRFLPLADLRGRSGWTLQLVAGNLERTVLNVLERSPDDGNLYYTRGERQGQPWYMLLYGDYPSREAAREAAERLPSALGAPNPWVRAFDSF